jgi:hypothetical protein
MADRSSSSETESLISFIRLIHSSFPAAALLDDAARHVKGVKGKGGLRGRVITCPADPPAGGELTPGDAAIHDAFKATRIKVAEMKTIFERPDSARGAAAFDFAADNKYLNTSFGAVEFDCLVKVPAGLGEWTQDSEAERNETVFVLTPDGTEDLPPRPAAPPPELPAVATAAADVSCRDTAYSRDNYPAGAAQYVIGEVYTPATASKFKDGMRKKLVQMERNIGLLMAKEGKFDVRDVVLGAMFMGPFMCRSVAQMLGRTIHAYRDALPYLAALLAAPRRVLAVFTPRFEPAIAHLHVSMAVDGLRKESHIHGRRIDTLSAEVGSLSAEVGSLRNDFVALRNDMVSLRGEFAALRGDVAANSVELRDGMRSVTDFLRQIQEVRQEQAVGFGCAVS